MTTSTTAPRNRLVHSRSAHMRAIQISQKTAFAYCEGRNVDPFIYSQIMAKAHPNGAAFCALYHAEEIRGTGGKESLIRLFKHFRAKKILSRSFKGKQFCCVFFFDKDVDDLSRKCLKSKHALYTQQYDLEGHLYREGDLRHAAAVSINSSQSKIPEVYDDASLWAEKKARHWRAWITLCLYSATFGVDCGCSYGRPSAINPGLLGPTDSHAFATFKTLLMVKSAITAPEFEMRLRKLENLIRKLEAKNMLGTVFKGKWLEAIIAAELQAQYAGQPVNLKELGPRVTSALMSRADFSSPWGKKIVKELRDIVSLCLG